MNLPNLPNLNLCKVSSIQLPVIQSVIKVNVKTFDKISGQIGQIQSCFLRENDGSDDVKVRIYSLNNCRFTVFRTVNFGNYETTPLQSVIYKS